MLFLNPSRLSSLRIQVWFRNSVDTDCWMAITFEMYVTYLLVPVQLNAKSSWHNQSFVIKYRDPCPCTLYSIAHSSIVIEPKGPVFRIHFHWYFFSWNCSLSFSVNNVSRVVYRSYIRTFVIWKIVGQLIKKYCVYQKVSGVEMYVIINLDIFSNHHCSNMLFQHPRKVKIKLDGVNGDN